MYSYKSQQLYQAMPGEKSIAYLAKLDGNFAIKWHLTIRLYGETFFSHIYRNSKTNYIGRMSTPLIMFSCLLLYRLNYIIFVEPHNSHAKHLLWFWKRLEIMFDSNDKIKDATAVINIPFVDASLYTLTASFFKVIDTIIIFNELFCQSFGNKAV